MGRRRSSNALPIVKGHYIFGVVIFDFKQIGNLTVGFLRQITAHLHINTLVAPYCHKVNFFRFINKEDWLVDLSLYAIEQITKI